MKYYLIEVAFVIAIFVIFALSANIGQYIEDNGLYPFDYAKITDVDYKDVVDDTPDSGGKINITERLTFDIHAFSRNNLFWELWRDLVEDKVDGLDIKYHVNSVTQILDDGTRIPYSESSKLYWDDSDYALGSRKWYHSPGPYNNYNRYECVFFYVNGMYREKPTFEINYDMYNAVLRYNDCSELYISLYSESSIKFLKSFKAQILLPSEKMPSKDNYTVTTYGTNSNGFPVEESDTLNKGYHTFSFNLDESNLKFKPHNQYIEFSLVSFGEDKHIFSQYANRNLYYNDDALDEILEEQDEYGHEIFVYAILKSVILIISIVISYSFIKYVLNVDKKVQKKYKFYNPDMRMEYFRDIPSSLDPVFAANLAFIRDGKNYKEDDVYSAILLSLVRKGYIELERVNPLGGWDDSNIKIVIKNSNNSYYIKEILQYDSTMSEIDNLFSEFEDAPKLEPLTESESHYYNLILRHCRYNETTMRVFQAKISYDYEYTDNFVTNIHNSVITTGINGGYFQKAKYAEPKDILSTQAYTAIVTAIMLLLLANPISYFSRLDLAFGSYFILGISLLIGGINLLKKSKKYILLTQFGEDEYAKWKGLYDFLDSETLMKERTVIELPIWEQYLVYATAFGISDKVVKALKIRCPNIEDYQSSPILRNPYYRSSHFHTSCHSFGGHVRSGSSTFRSGGYGGYGGGGRGGGGGRRRSLI